MPTSFLNLSIGSKDAHGAEVSSFPPALGRGWTGNQPTVRQFTLTGAADNTITVPEGCLLIASPMTDLINLIVKGIAADTGNPMCHPTLALNIPWSQPWDGTTNSFVIENLEETSQTITLWFF